MANENSNHIIISCSCYVWDGDFIRKGTGPSSLFRQFLAHWVPMKAENKIWWEWCLCFQWEWWPVPAKGKALAELLCDHTRVQLWVWTKRLEGRTGSGLCPSVPLLPLSDGGWLCWWYALCLRNLSHSLLKGTQPVFVDAVEQDRFAPLTSWHLPI